MFQQFQDRVPSTLKYDFGLKSIRFIESFFEITHNHRRYILHILYFVGRHTALIFKPYKRNKVKLTIVFEKMSSLMQLNGDFRKMDLTSIRFGLRVVNKPRMDHLNKGAPSLRNIFYWSDLVLHYHLIWLQLNNIPLKIISRAHLRSYFRKGVIYQ